MNKLDEINNKINDLKNEKETIEAKVFELELYDVTNNIDKSETEVVKDFEKITKSKLVAVTIEYDEMEYEDGGANDWRKYKTWGLYIVLQALNGVRVKVVQDWGDDVYREGYVEHSINIPEEQDDNELYDELDEFINENYCNMEKTAYKIYERVGKTFVPIRFEGRTEEELNEYIKSLNDELALIA